MIEDTINVRVISELDPREKVFSNHIFIVHQEHRTTKNRLIFDMSYLNQFISFPKFSLLKIPSILHILNNSQFAAKIDLSKAFYRIPIHKSFKKFFTFAFNKKKYQFNNMPFGLNAAPYIFNSVMTSIICYLRKTFGIQFFSYLDDILILGKKRISNKLCSIKNLKSF